MVAYGYGYGDVVAAAAVRRAHVDFVELLSGGYAPRGWLRLRLSDVSDRFLFDSDRFWVFLTFQNCFGPKIRPTAKPSLCVGFINSSIIEEETADHDARQLRRGLLAPSLLRLIAPACRRSMLLPPPNGGQQCGDEWCR